MMIHANKIRYQQKICVVLCHKIHFLLFSCESEMFIFGPPKYIIRLQSIFCANNHGAASFLRFEMNSKRKHTALYVDIRAMAMSRSVFFFFHFLFKFQFLAYDLLDTYAFLAVGQLKNCSQI